MDISSSSLQFPMALKPPFLPYPGADSDRLWLLLQSLRLLLSFEIGPPLFPSSSSESLNFTISLYKGERRDGAFENRAPAAAAFPLCAVPPEIKTTVTYGAAALSVN